MTITCFKKAGRQVQPTKLLLMRFVAHRTLTMVEPGLVGWLVGAVGLADLSSAWKWMSCTTQGEGVTNTC